MLIWFINHLMNYRIDNLQYCNWSRKIFEINREANLDAVHVTIVYHEDYHEFLMEFKDFGLSKTAEIPSERARRSVDWP